MWRRWSCGGCRLRFADCGTTKEGDPASIRVTGSVEEALRCVPEAQQLELLRFPHWFARPVKTSHSRMSPAVVVPYGTATSRDEGIDEDDMAGGGVGRWHQ